jgi:hypothetical protein
LQFGFFVILVTGLSKARVSNTAKTSLPLHNFQAIPGSHLLPLHTKHHITNVTNKTMSTPPAAKRRRVDSIGIHKPFVSPLKRNAPTTSTSTPAPSRTQPAPSTPYTPLRSSNLKTSTPLHRNTSHDPYDPVVVRAQQDIKALEARIRVLRSQNGILAQAAQITTPSQPSSQCSHPSSQQPPQSQHPRQQPRLIRLSQKWLKASQLAAEEVFSSFEQSIKDNGGYNTFLSQQRQSSSNSFFGEFNDEREVNDEGNEDNWRDEEGDMLTERGKRQRRGMIEENASKQQHKREGDEEQEREKEDEEQELSLGVMLKVLNIDPEVIGWDNKTLAWK